MRTLLLALAAAVAGTLVMAPEAQAYYPRGNLNRGVQRQNNAWNSPRARRGVLPSPAIYAGREGWYFPGLRPLTVEDLVGPPIPAAGRSLPR